MKDQIQHIIKIIMPLINSGSGVYQAFDEKTTHFWYRENCLYVIADDHVHLWYRVIGVPHIIEIETKSRMKQYE